jgi:hypothetical protein
MLPISSQIYTPGVILTITEANFKQFEIEDAFSTTVSYFYDLQEKASTWREGDCQYFKASNIDDTNEFFRIGNCKNGSSLFYYGSNSARPFNAGEVLTEVMKNGTKVTYFADARRPIREDPELQRIQIWPQEGHR